LKNLTFPNKEISLFTKGSEGSTAPIVILEELGSKFDAANQAESNLKIV
jgi:hypothetical protein